MRRNIFNIHKHKKKWGRGFKKASCFMFASSQNTVKRDFAWKKSRKNNPFWQETESIDWKKRIELIIFSLAILSLLLLALYHPFFHIEKVEVAGLQRISETEFKDSALGVTKYNRLLLFPGQSYFIVNLDEIRDILKDKYALESIIVRKQFPDTINITVEEKISTIIYDNGEKYSYIGTNGNVVEILRQVGEDEWQGEIKITTSTNELGEVVEKRQEVGRSHTPAIKNVIAEMGDYPIVYDTRHRSADVNTNVLFDNTVSGIISWFNIINKKTDIPFKYIEINNEIGDAVIKTYEGWEMRVNLHKDIDTQFEELQYLLKNKITRPNLNYIDLRYPGKVYWQ